MMTRDVTSNLALAGVAVWNSELTFLIWPRERDHFAERSVRLFRASPTCDIHMPFLDRITRSCRLTWWAQRRRQLVPRIGAAALLIVATTAAVPAVPFGVVRPRHDDNGRWPVPDAALRSGTLIFTGHSTVGTFVGTTTAVRGGLSGAVDIAKARGWVEAPVATLSTENDRRDRDLRAVMEVDKYSTMRFDLTGVTGGSPGAALDTAHVTLQGGLTIHGVTRVVSIPATLVTVGDTMDVSGRFPLDLTDYQIGGLTRFFGALRMQKDIEVRFRVRFEARPRTAELGR